MRNKNAKLQLKGRIFMTNVTDVVSLSRPGMSLIPFFDWRPARVANFPDRIV